MADVDCLVLGSVNAAMRRAIDVPALVDALGGGPAVHLWPEHVRAFFEEVPREAIFRFMLAHRLNGTRVSTTCRTVTEESPHSVDLATWIAELSHVA